MMNFLYQQAGETLLELVWERIWGLGSHSPDARPPLGGPKGAVSRRGISPHRCRAAVHFTAGAESA